MQGEIICARAGGIIQRNFHKYINTVKWIHVMRRHFISELLMCLPINLSGMFTLICSIYLRRMFNNKTAKTAELVHRRASQVSDAEFALKGPCTDVCSGRQMHKSKAQKLPGALERISDSTHKPDWGRCLLFAPQREDPLSHTSFWQDHPAPRLLPPFWGYPSTPVGTKCSESSGKKLSHYSEFQLISAFWLVPDFPGIISSNIQTVMDKFSPQSFAELPAQAEWLCERAQPPCPGMEPAAPSGQQAGPARTRMEPFAGRCFTSPHKQ